MDFNSTLKDILQYSFDMDTEVIRAKGLLKKNDLNAEMLALFLIESPHSFIREVIDDDALIKHIQRQISWEEIRHFLLANHQEHFHLLSNYNALIYPDCAWELFSQEQSELHLEMLLKHHYQFTQEDWNKDLFYFFKEKFPIVNNPLLFFKCVNNTLEHVNPFEKSDNIASELTSIIQAMTYFEEMLKSPNHQAYEIDNVVPFLQKLVAQNVHFHLDDRQATLLAYNIAYNEPKHWNSLFEPIYAMTENRDVYDSSDIEVLLNTFHNDNRVNFLTYMKSFIEQKKLNLILDKEQLQVHKLKL